LTHQGCNGGAEHDGAATAYDITPIHDVTLADQHGYLPSFCADSSAARDD
jgi:hypothetical protein